MGTEPSATWVRKMAHWLPYHQDRYFVALNNAMAGTYRLRFEEDAEPNTDAAEAAFERRMAEMHRKAEPMLRAIQPRKRGGR
jgi:DTW domain-containing protein YfiP